MFNYLWPHEPQHARHPCPSPTAGVHPNPCPLIQWCHPTISSSVIPFSSCPQSFPSSGSFQMGQLFTSGGQSIGVSASTSVDCVDHDKLWNALREMGTPDHLTWENCMQVKKQQLEPCMEQLIGSRLRKGYDRAVCCHPVYLTDMLSTSWEMLGWMSYKPESR